MLRKLSLLVLCSALGLGSFFAVARGVRCIVPWPGGSGVRAKMEFFAEHRDEYDALIIGSSRAFRGLDPRLIDAHFADAGLDVRTFNLAVGGMRSFEQDFILRRVLEMQPARLRWIFYEGGPLGMGLREDHVFRDPPNLMSARSVMWHTPETTAALLASVRVLPVPLRERLAFARTHLTLLGWHLANYGMGEEVLGRWLEGQERRRQFAETLERLAEGEGHQGLEEASGREMADELREFLEDPAPFQERMAAVVQENALDCDLGALNAELYREHDGLARAHGCTLIYFTPPGYEGTPERLRAHEAGVLPRLVHLNDPLVHPELFRLDHRFDKGHLNRRGTERLSELFARGMLTHMSAPVGQPPVRASGQASDGSH